MDKYYTPDISEFHNGFEYEIMISKHSKLSGLELSQMNISESDIEMIEDWEKKTFKLLADITIYLKEDVTGDIDALNLHWIKRGLETNSIRVKYLDKEDIESLRWKTFSFANEEITLFNNDSITKDIVIEANFESHELWIKFDAYTEDQYQLFQGTIKNKSELKILMKQLKII